MKLRIFITLISLLSLQFLNAQSLNEAVRYSNFNIHGTASAMATGNALNAMGADFTSASMNPAGIAGFRKSYFILTSAFINLETEAGFDSYDVNTRNKDRFGINNIGFVFASHSENSRWTQSNVAIGMNKLADFNSEFYYSGKTIGSITERFIERANGKTTDEMDGFEAWPAVDVGAIYQSGAINNYVSDIKLGDQLVTKNQSIARSGSMTELVIAWAGNYNNNLDVGISLGVPFVNFEEVKYYEESDAHDEISNFNQLNYKEYLSTKGTGLNLKFGAIYKTSLLRFGLSFQSPTWTTLKDEYYVDLRYQYNDNDGTSNDYTHESPIGSFKYKLITPWSSTASVGTLFKSGDWRGFVNLDLTFKDYRSNRFNLQSFSDAENELKYELELNEEVNTQLNNSLDYRIGGELVYKKLRLRMGFASLGSPYAADNGSSTEQVYSLGTGYRWNNISLDVAYKLSNREEGYIPYLVLNESRNQLVTTNEYLGEGALTLAFNF